MNAWGNSLNHHHGAEKEDIERAKSEVWEARNEILSLEKELHRGIKPKSSENVTPIPNLPLTTTARRIDHTVRLTFISPLIL
jgi:hypothetical protein